MLPQHHWNSSLSLATHPGGGGSFTKIVRGCACRTSKIWLSLYQFFAKFPTHQYTIFESKLGAFYNNLPKIHPIYVIWAPSSLMKTPRSLYQISRKGAPKGRHIYVYHVNVRTPPPPGATHFCHINVLRQSRILWHTRHVQYNHGWQLCMVS